MLHKTLKYTFLFFLFLAIYILVVVIILPLFRDPSIHRFESYYRLWNWDLKHHARGADFDHDGQDDLITFTGCAILSSVEADSIPLSQQCTAEGIARVLAGSREIQIGQKYVPTNRTALTLDGAYNEDLMSHSYLGKNKNENWKIFVNSKRGLEVYEIGADGLLQPVDEIPFSHRIDEWLYFLSRLFLLLALPLVPVLILLSLFIPGPGEGIVLPLYRTTLVAAMAAVFFWVWKRSSKS
jgi:hypothetical protein